MKQVAIQVVDLGFGDSGKGTMVDYLVRRAGADLVVRYNGGPQAAHNVVLPDGRHHTFAQFGSGSFIPGVQTLLSRFMLIEPYAMLNEAAHLASIGVSDIFSRTLIDERCLLITPPHQIANRLRERARGEAAHGTCGMGIGECVADSIERPELRIMAADMRDRGTIRRKLAAVLEQKRAAVEAWRPLATAEELRLLDDPAWIDVASDAYGQVADRATIISADRAVELLADSRCAIFEGAQGVLLDEIHGFHPHTTWSTTTFANADALLDEAGSAAFRERIGVIRTYMTRHGAGPFPTGRADLDRMLPEPHNGDHGFQGRFRRGVLDLVLLRHALTACGGVCGLAVTHCDRLPLLPPAVCDGYEINGAICRTIPPGCIAEAVPRYRPTPVQDEAAFIKDVEGALETPVLHASYGPTWQQKRAIQQAHPAGS